MSRFENDTERMKKSISNIWKIPQWRVVIIGNCFMGIISKELAEEIIERSTIKA